MTFNSKQEVLINHNKTAHNILQPKQYPKQCENDEKSLWGKLLSGRRHETDNVLKFGQGFKQLGYIYK